MNEVFTIISIAVSGFVIGVYAITVFLLIINLFEDIFLYIIERYGKK